MGLEPILNSGISRWIRSPALNGCTWVSSFLPQIQEARIVGVLGRDLLLRSPSSTTTTTHPRPLLKSSAFPVFL